MGDRNYLAHDGEVALVIDPQRDIDRVTEMVDQLRLRVTHVAEAHIHNDYLTGGLDLAERTGAAYLVDARDEVGFERTRSRRAARSPSGRCGCARSRPRGTHTTTCPTR